MPSSEDCISAQAQVREWAKQALIKEGHSAFSANAIVQHMSYEAQIAKAEEIVGPLYRGPYSAY